MNTINKKDIEISPENPFKNCKLGREKIARSLTKIIKNINVDNGFVISIDSPWGTGKTTFIDMWKALLEKDEEENIICVKFNAWDNDFYNDPLISILENLDEAIDKDIEKITKNFAQDSWENVKSNLKTKGKALICDAIKAKTHGLIDISGEEREDDLLKNYGNLKEKNGKIKKGLMELKKEFGENNKLRIVFFIDELDRCRPDYAIKVLEIIKHFFRTEGYIFILSLDKSQLSKSISTIYGQGMDSEGYLRRFIDVDYTLPMPSKEKYIESLLEKHSLDKSTVFVRRVYEILNVEENISLRDIEKLFFKLKIFLYSKTNIPPERMNVEKNWIFDSIYAYFFVLNFLYFELYNDLFSEKPKCFNPSLTASGAPIENRDISELFRKTLKWFENYENYQAPPNTIANSLIKKIHSILFSNDTEKSLEIRKYTNRITGQTINDRLDISLLFNEEGEFIIKNDIEMINGIND
ncbi:MAG: P-loop NTPase fold protein [Fusobacterium sp. JB019]|nr:P-loop NTPase fold protein [Fusobacterium sp. JB019]